MKPATELKKKANTVPATKPGMFAARKAPQANRGESGDVRAVISESLHEAAQRKCKPAARALYAFVRDIARDCRTGNRDPRTNIIDQGEKATYAMNGELSARLLDHLDAVRREGSTVHFSQKQGTAERPLAGIMLDFDTTHSSARVNLTPRVYNRFAHALACRLQQEIAFTAADVAGAAGDGPVEFRTHIFFIVKPAPEAIPTGKAATPEDKFRFGIHILVPGVRVSRAYKKWAYRKAWKDDGVFNAALKELGALGDTRRCLDENSASVPVFFLGSCKAGSSAPYGLAAAFEVIFSVGGGAGGGAGFGSQIDGVAVSPPVVLEVPIDDALLARNLVAELDLVDEAPEVVGDDGGALPPLVRKLDFNPRPAILTQAEAFAARTEDDVISGEELAETDNSVSLLALTDPEARVIHEVLGLLPSEFYSDRNKRRDVIFALANTREAYKPLAEWFCQKFAERWHNSTSDNGREAFERLWEDAVARAARGTADGSRPLTVRSLHYWAKNADVTRYSEAMQQNYFTAICRDIYEYEGHLEHSMVARVLHMMLGTKFRVDVDPLAAGRPVYVWYEFVVPGQPMKLGEVWKWRREAEPDEVQRYISDKFAGIVLRNVQEDLDTKETNAESEAYAKFYKGVKRAFMASRRKMFNDGFKTGVIRQCSFLFRARGFAASLDQDGKLLGVGNGVLRLDCGRDEAGNWRQVELIDRFHEFPVSRFTRTCFTHRFDPLTNPWDRIVADMFEKVIPEPDAREWILYNFASCLSGEPKEGLILLWIGGGANGKTTALRSIYKALEIYARKLSIGLFTAEREKPNQPNSAMMALKGTRFGFVEEMNRGEDLNEARLKEIVNPGEVTGSEKFQKQEEFTVTANITLASQYYFRIASQDHGLWRRIRSYQSVIKFTRTPDPGNPLEILDDQRFVREYPDAPEYKESILSLLVHYFERLAREHGGQLKNVRSPTIERQTAEFRNTQDTLNRFITERIAVSPAYPATYQTSTLGLMYAEWFTKTVDKKHRYVAGETIKDLENSMLAKYLKPSPNRTTILAGCRVLTETEMQLREGEEFLADAEMRGREQPGAEREPEWTPQTPKNPTWWLANPAGAPQLVEIHQPSQLPGGVGGKVAGAAMAAPVVSSDAEIAATLAELDALEGEPTGVDINSDCSSSTDTSAVSSEDTPTVGDTLIGETSERDFKHARAVVEERLREEQKEREVLALLAVSDPPECICDVLEFL